MLIFENYSISFLWPSSLCFIYKQSKNIIISIKQFTEIKLDSKNLIAFIAFHFLEVYCENVKYCTHMNGLLLIFKYYLRTCNPRPVAYFDITSSNYLLIIVKYLFINSIKINVNNFKFKNLKWPSY